MHDSRQLTSGYSMAVVLRLRQIPQLGNHYILSWEISGAQGKGAPLLFPLPFLTQGKPYKTHDNALL